MKDSGKGFEPSQWAKYFPCRGCPIGQAHVAAFDVKLPGFKRTMGMHGRIDTVAITLPEAVDPPPPPPEPEPEAKAAPLEDDVRFDYEERGDFWFVRGWVNGRVITGGPFTSQMRAFRWISKRVAKEKKR